MAFCYISGTAGNYFVKKVQDDSIQRKGFSNDFQMQSWIEATYPNEVVGHEFWGLDAYQNAVAKANSLNNPSSSGGGIVTAFPIATGTQSPFMQIATTNPYTGEPYSATIPTTPTGQPAAGSVPQATKQVQISFGLYNPMNTLPDPIHIKNTVGSVTNVVGWECVSCQTTMTSVDLNFKATGTPILPIAAIVGAVLLCLVIGAVIISFNIKAVNLADAETAQLKQVSDQIKSTGDLANLITEEYQAGQIQYNDYIALMKQVTSSQATLAKTSSNVSNTSSQDTSLLGNIGLGNLTTPLLIIGGIVLLSKI